VCNPGISLAFKAEENDQPMLFHVDPYIPAPHQVFAVGRGGEWGRWNEREAWCWRIINMCVAESFVCGWCIAAEALRLNHRKADLDDSNNSRLFST
jgi:hypothetical protein